MKADDTVSRVERLRKGNGEDWRAVLKKGKGKEQNEESSLISEYFMHASIERERRLLDDKRVKWIARRMEMIAEEMKDRFKGEMEAEYRVNKQVVDKKPEIATKPSWERRWMRHCEHYWMELLLLCEIKEYEQRFWNKFKVFLDQIGSDRVEEKERLTREWKSDCWRRLSPQLHAAVRRLADIGEEDEPEAEFLGKQWASTISQFFEEVERPDSISLSTGRLKDAPYQTEEISLRMKKEIEDTEFHLKLGSDLGRFDQFWDDDYLFECRYSRSKWFYLEDFSDVRHVRDRAPFEVYLHALKGNKNIIHVTLAHYNPDSDVKQFHAIICDLPPWVTSISCDRDSFGPLPTIHHDLLFIKPTNNDLITFAKEIRLKLDPSSTYIFTNAGNNDVDLGKLRFNARILISFFAPTSGQRLILRLKYSGEDGCLEVILGSTKIQLNPSSKSSLTIDDTTLYPIQELGPDRLSFEPGVWNDIVVQFARELDHWTPGLSLHDVELLNEAGLEYP